ncbi:MAG: NAD(P)H-dependent oxidoreductase subunit E [Actinobacteria bacterium]|nr:MAG: NAD(P)H-dependent oxidoreductase subunit E [Actinomycetota bacterium]
MTAVPRFTHGSRVPGWDDAVDLDRPPAPVPDPATTPVPPGLRAEIEGYMAKYPDRRSAALPALRAAQREHGWCSPEAIDQVACVMRLTPGYVDALATFYDMLETEPRRHHHDVYVCTNISCSLLGADELYATIRAAAEGDDDVHVREFECLGACDIAPMASVDGTYVGPLEPADAERILEDLRGGGPVLPDKQILRRPVADPEANSRQYPRPEPRPESSEYARSAGPEIPGDAPGPPAPLHDERHPPEPGKRQGTTP